MSRQPGRRVSGVGSITQVRSLDALHCENGLGHGSSGARAACLPVRPRRLQRHAGCHRSTAAAPRDWATPRLDAATHRTSLIPAQQAGVHGEHSAAVVLMMCPAARCSAAAAVATVAPTGTLRHVANPANALRSDGNPLSRAAS